MTTGGSGLMEAEKSFDFNNLTFKGALEKQLRKKIIKIHQDVIGKGPEDVKVLINHNVITFVCTKTLSQIELFLLKTEGGEQEIRELRVKIMEHLKPLITAYLEYRHGIKVLGLTIDVSISADALFGAVLIQLD